MKTAWSEYLESIGITGSFFKRVQEVLDFYEKVCPDEIEEIFVTDYFDADGNRQYENLWFFSQTASMEASQFLKQDDFDSVPLNNQIHRWNIKKTEYDFQEATTKSRLVVSFFLVYDLMGTLKASQENCDKLKAVFHRYIVPNAVQSVRLPQEEHSSD